MIKKLFFIALLFGLSGSLYAQTPITIDPQNGLTEIWSSDAAVLPGQIVKLTSTGRLIPLTVSDDNSVIQGIAVTGVKQPLQSIIITILGITRILTDGACAIGNFVSISTTKAGYGHCSGSSTGSFGTAVTSSASSGSISINVTSSSSGGGGSSTVNVNGSAVSNPNFNSAAPSPDANNIALPYKVSGSNVIGEAPFCTGTTAGVVPTPPNNVNLFLNGQCGFTAAAGSYNTVIDAASYGPVAGGLLFDAQWSNSSSTVSFPNSDCPTSVTVGTQIFGVKTPATFSGAGIYQVPKGTVSAGCGGLASGTLTVSTTTTGACTPVVATTNCAITWRPADQSTAINNWTTAVINAAGCPAGIFPQGVFGYSKAIGNQTATNPGTCITGTGVTEQGPSFLGIGANWSGSVLVMWPDFDFTTCTGGVSGHACNFGTAGSNVSNFVITAAGNPFTGTTNTVNILEPNGGAIVGNSFYSNLALIGVLTADPNSIGLYADSASLVQLTNVIVNAGGATPCEGNVGGDPNEVVAFGGQCANGSVGASANVCGLRNYSIWEWHAPYAGCANPTTTGEISIRNEGSGTLKLFGGINTIISTGAGTNYMLQNAGSAFIDGMKMTTAGSNAGTIFGVYTFTSGNVSMLDTQVTTTSGVALDTSGTAGGTLTDLGGNVISGTSANLLGAGTVFGGLFVAQNIPTIASGFGTSSSVASGSYWNSFTINVGTSNTGTGVLTLPAALTGWACSATDKTTTSATVFFTRVVPTSTTSVTFQNYSDAAATHAWVDSDILTVQCSPN